MPKTAKEGGADGAKTPFPEAKACKHPQIVPRPQVSPADAKGGDEPDRPQLQGHEQLGDDGEAPVEGPEQVCHGSQGGPPQKTAQPPAPGQCRAHRQSPRFGSS